MGDFLFGLLIIGGIFLFLYWAEWKEYESTGRETDLFHIGRENNTKEPDKAAESIKINSHHAVFLSRIKSETGLDDVQLRERIVKNTGKIERIYRNEEQIPQEHSLYGSGKINDDFFKFYLGYILDDKLFDRHEWLIEDEPNSAVNVKDRVEDTTSNNPKSNYGVIAKQMVQGSDPYGAIWDRMRNDIGISNARFKRRLTRNTSRLENMYRKQRGIPASRELFNRRGYVDDDFFAFLLGYILADHLFGSDDKLVAEAATRNSGEAEVEPEYDEVNSWDESTWDDYNRDEFDFDELEFMEPWERRQALEDAGFDPNDFDYDSDGFDSDLRDTTFQDDFGFNGDDMYDSDGEFRDY